MHYEQPYCELFDPTEGKLYRITSTSTYAIIGDNSFPLDLCPYPFTQIQMKVILAFMGADWKKVAMRLAVWVPGWIILALAITAFSLIVNHPACSEMLKNTLMMWFLVTVSIMALFFALFIAWQFFRSAQNVAKEEMQLLMAGAARLSEGAIDIRPDLLVIQEEEEPGDKFMYRVKTACTNVGEGVWLVAFGYREPMAAIFKTPTNAIVFERADPPFQKEVWLDQHRICPINATFDSETYHEFNEYIKAFLFYYKKWAPMKKVTAVPSDEAAITWMDAISKKTTAIILALVCAVSLMGQPASTQVDGVLKRSASDIPEKGVEVQYIFDSGTILKRVGDGIHAYKKLLTILPGYIDKDHGKLIMVTAGKVVGKTDMVGEARPGTPSMPANADLRPIGSSGTQPNGWTTSIRMPDSNEIYNMTGEATQMAYRARSAAELVVRPANDVVMSWIAAFFPWIFFFGVMAWVWAKGSAIEGMYNLYKKSRRVFAWFALIFGTILCFQGVLLSTAMGLDNLTVAVIILIEGGLFYVLFTKLTPDFRPAAGNAPIIKQGYDPTTPRIEP